MKIGIITLVSDNYGNKFQNYAVENIMKQYGKVETIRLENCNKTNCENKTSKYKKVKPSYIRQVLISRMMYKYDMNNAERSVLGNLFYILKNKKKILKARDDRHKNFQRFEKKYLHISEKIISHNDINASWLNSYNYFICGSDQIWNPGYSTTSDLAFLSFSPKKKNIALAPSFGVSKIPESMIEMFRNGINGIERLSVREEAGANIIRELTGRKAEILVDPTMVLDVDEWKKIMVKPKAILPEKYILCYFLGRVDKQYKSVIRKLAKERNLRIVPLFDIEEIEYYSLDPAEVLYCIENAEMVVTDSFHGTVFSILFHKEFMVFERNEGGASMNSRLDTLLKRFNLQNRIYPISSNINSVNWNDVDNYISSARSDYFEYLKKCELEKR